MKLMIAIFTAGTILSLAGSANGQTVTLDGTPARQVFNSPTVKIYEATQSRLLFGIKPVTEKTTILLWRPDWPVGQTTWHIAAGGASIRAGQLTGTHRLNNPATPGPVDAVLVVR